jgi:glutamine amidotransferase
MRVALVDYGAGNLTSVRKAFAALGAAAAVCREPAALAAGDAVVVPGVGHFEATASLGGAWRDAVQAAIGRGDAVLGICLGLQWLFEGSEEAPGVPGLGVLRGRCALLRPETVAAVRPAGGHDGASPSTVLKVPHVGWNDVRPVQAAPLLDGLAPGAQAYFTHSYAAPVTAETIAVTVHGVPFASVVGHGRVWGVQFHPEKSGRVGLLVLANFLRLAAEDLRARAAD